MIDEIKASANFRHFRNRLNHAVLGSRSKRHGAQLLMMAVLELSADSRLHYHCIIDRPYYWSLERFSALVREQWWKTDFGYQQATCKIDPTLAGHRLHPQAATEAFAA